MHSTGAVIKKEMNSISCIRTYHPACCWEYRILRGSYTSRLCLGAGAWTSFHYKYVSYLEEIYSTHAEFDEWHKRWREEWGVGWGGGCLHRADRGCDKCMEIPDVSVLFFSPLVMPLTQTLLQPPIETPSPQLPNNLTKLRSTEKDVLTVFTVHLFNISDKKFFVLHLASHWMSITTSWLNLAEQKEPDVLTHLAPIPAAYYRGDASFKRYICKPIEVTVVQQGHHVF